MPGNVSMPGESGVPGRRIVTLTLNPAIDRTVVLEALALGAVNRVAETREDMGGKGINVARILRSLGSESLAAGFIGRQNLSLAQALLARDAIPADLIPVDGATRVNVKILETRTRTTTDLNAAGFPVGPAELDGLATRLRRLAAGSAFTVLSGSVPPGVPATIYRTLIELLRPLCRIALDADGDFLRHGLDARPFLVKPNRQELENALGCPLSTPEAVVAAGRDIVARGQAEMVLVSLGADGAILVTERESLMAEPVPVIVRGTVGAGDAMLAGFLHALALGEPARTALSWATACGALAVSRTGTEAFSRTEAAACAAKAVIRPL